MTKNIEEYYAPWIKGIPMYISDHIEKAWRDPSLHRMMSNENPLPPSDKVLEAMIKYAKMANRYPDQGLVVRTKIAEMNGVDGPGNVMIGNGSSEVYDNIFRMFITPGDVKRAALPVLRHRIQLAPEVAISGQSVDQVLESVIRSVEAPRS